MTVKGVVQNFMECSSLNALPFIVNAENKFIKLLWMLIFIAGTGGMIYNLFYVLSQYLEYETTTAIAFKSSNLSFPDVLICGKNTVRKSMIASLNESNFKDFLNKFVNASTVSGVPIQKQVPIKNPFGKKGTSWNQNVRSTMKLLYGGQKRKVRREIGHQIEDMLLNCEFNGKTCSASEFVLKNTMDYGNCYFFNPEARIINTPGSGNGLHLKLYLEGNEFIPYLSQYGLQVLVSPPNAMMFPSDLGIYASSNFETRIAVTQNDIFRMDDNYGPCNSSDTKLGEREQKIYTKYSCTVLCEITYAEEQCGCINPEDVDYALVQEAETSMTICNVTKNKCVQDAKEAIRNESVSDCSDYCGYPCNETTYSLSVSTQMWPDFYETTSLVNYLCKQNSSGCEDMRKLQFLRQRDNFASLTIFYEKMQITNYTESESYDFVSFVSDFGGTMGLWIGISAITIIEIIYFVCRLGCAGTKFLCCGSRSKTVDVELK